jgi:hypothetical protein
LGPKAIQTLKFGPSENLASSVSGVFVEPEGLAPVELKLAKGVFVEPEGLPPVELKVATNLEKDQVGFSQELTSLGPALTSDLAAM